MKRSKRIVFLGSKCLLIMVAAILLMAANAGAATPKPVTLACTVHFPPPPPAPAKMFAEHLVLLRWANEIEARTEGRVKVKYYHSAVLGKPMDFLRMVGGAGVADMGLLISVFHQWEVPLFAGTHLPFLYTGVETPVRAYLRLYKEWAPMREEWVKHNVKPLWLYAADPYYMLLNKPISNMDDLKGQKIYGPGGFAGIVKRFGGAPTFIPGPEAYEALQRGVLDGLAFPFSPIYSFRFYEVRKVFVDFTFVGAQAGCMMVINQDVWNKISPKDQKALEKISAQMPDHYIKYYRETLAYLMDYYKTKGNTFITLSPKEEARVKERCAQEMWDEWAAMAEQKGVPAKEFLKRYKAIVKDVTK